MSLSSPLSPDDLPDLPESHKRATTELITRSACLLDQVNGPSAPVQAVKSIVRGYDDVPLPIVETALLVLTEVHDSIRSGRSIGQADITAFTSS
jgi:hypothetical protein